MIDLGCWLVEGWSLMIYLLQFLDCMDKVKKTRFLVSKSVLLGSCFLTLISWLIQIYAVGREGDIFWIVQ